MKIQKQSSRINTTKINRNCFHTTTKFTQFHINSCNAQKNETISENRESCKILNSDIITIKINEKKNAHNSTEQHASQMNVRFIYQIN